MSYSKAGFPQNVEQERWILALLYAPCNKQKAVPISYPSEISAQLFILERKLVSQFEYQQLYCFTPSKYTPRSDTLASILSEFESQGIISKTEQEDGGVSLQLTTEGFWRAKTAFETLSTEEKHLVRWIKNKFKGSISRMLSFIHRQYPEFMTQSVTYSSSDSES